MRQLLVILLSVSAIRAAEKPCAWMNAASAAGFLEGPVETVLTRNAQDGTCEFTRTNSAAKLRIEVTSTPYKPQCANAEPLKAIGNEAVFCAPGEVIGRVRTQTFVVRITAPFAPQVLHDKAVKAAEQVSGNMF